MSSVSAVGNSIQSNYQSLASGRKINSAADNASGLAIAEKQESQIRTLNQGEENAKESKNLFEVSDSALSTLTDYVHRVKELAIQSINGLSSKSDKQAIQGEIDQLKQGINEVAKNTQFNERKLLDGSDPNMTTVTGAGAASSATLPTMTLEALGLEDFDVTGEFDMDVLDQALEKISSARSNLGAQVNGLDYAQLYDQEASINLTDASNKITMEDYAEGSSELKKNTMLQDAQFIMQKQQMEDQEEKMKNFFI